MMALASGYWQVAMSPEAKRKAALVTNEGLFQFRVMPFGLCNALASVVRHAVVPLSGLPGRCDFIQQVYFGGPRKTGGGVEPPK